MKDTHFLEPSTIAAIATGSGGGIGIVRVSGARAEEIARRVLRPVRDEFVSHRMYAGRVIAPSGAMSDEVVDRVLFCLMRAPRSYTGEDVLEIHGHGGAVVLEGVLSAVLAAGAQPAQPGEFTRRAFLNGKLDLTQAEAVMSLVEARSRLSAQLARRQLEGSLGARISELRSRVIALLGEVEGALDFPDLEADRSLFVGTREELIRLGEGLSRLGESFTGGGQALRHGIEVAVLGRTNAGKSSLVNALCQAERVLVDARPGTTRDYVEAHASLEEGVAVTLIDTPGERSDPGDLERRGQRLSWRRAAGADLLLYVVDGTSGLTDEDRAIMKSLPARPRLLVWNKSDSQECLPPPEGQDASVCSALCGFGLDTLRRRMREALLPRVEAKDEVILTSLRQRNLIGAAAEGLRRARDALDEGRSWDLVACDLRAAAKLLGEVTGEEVSTEVLDEIFSRFCIGK